MGKQSYAVVLALIIVAMLVIGCGAATEELEESAPAGMPNPASVHCEEEGGVLDIRIAADGSQYGVCVFDDGSECEEWAFFRGECKPGEMERAPEP